jgi:hypothetical protein
MNNHHLSRTTAHAVASMVRDASAVSLYGGYAVHALSSRIIRFEPAHVVMERRDKRTHKVTSGVYRYADGSEIAFSERRGFLPSE